MRHARRQYTIAVVGALRTSEEGAVLAGDAKQARADDNRSVDAPGRIIIDSAPLIAPPQDAAPRPAPRPLPQPMPPAPRAAGGAWLVVLVYILATAALGAALYERFG
jgi:hypothetical protein